MVKANFKYIIPIERCLCSFIDDVNPKNDFLIPLTRFTFCHFCGPLPPVALDITILSLKIRTTPPPPEKFTFTYFPGNSGEWVKLMLFFFFRGCFSFCDLIFSEWVHFKLFFVKKARQKLEKIDRQKNELYKEKVRNRVSEWRVNFFGGKIRYLWFP